MINGIRGKRPLILVLLAVLCCMFIALPVFAAEGDGSGGGRDVPLALASSSLANGQSNVPVMANINLAFNKNVVNLAVKDNNMKCFSLSGNGISVPIQVIMPDDQVDFEHRRNIDIDPLQDLKPGTLYKLVISGQLQAKNGMSLGTPVSVSFTTAGAANVNQNTSTGPNTGSIKSGSAQTTQPTTSAEKVTTEKAAKENTKAAAENTKAKAAKAKTKSAAKTKSEEKETKSTSTKGIAAAAGLIIAAGVYGYYRFSYK
ncbi:MAG: Ig-like domain-containing protein [Syntrophomonas sp.]